MTHPLISADPHVMMGKPVIAGTRITVEHIIDELAGGRSIDELLDATLASPATQYSPRSPLQRTRCAPRSSIRLIPSRHKHENPRG